ncbi:peptidase S41 [Paenibacillus swuensis]|uniref:Peptidase S41 n=1 Tax=Paenibacillus swuensis TaxID=1178515 RepID=A0A172TI74_9BACL|nr:S41 family peptidase [Paenibacillus swuensis]ANE46741.1 peptidase S41 [Paenibacillus swuensis]
MQFKGRTVVAFILLSIFASSLITLTVVDSSFMVRQGFADEEGQQASSLTAKEMNKVAAAFSLIEEKYVTPIDRKKLVDGAIHGMVGALDDPYSSYMDEQEAEQFTDNVQGSFSGIGAEVTLLDGRVMVVSPIKGSPAEKAGIHAKDILLSVNGHKLDGLKLSDALTFIRGPKGTKAKIMILRQGSTEPTEITLVRDTIDVETVFSTMLDGQIGKIEIRQFSKNTGERFLADLKSLEAKGMKGLVIDVRNDPGGILPVVVQIAQPFVPKGEAVVQVEDRAKRRKATPSEGEGKPYPVVVLINKGSASASEILAAAIREGGGGKLMGETSFGKGTVQISYGEEMGDGSILKMTIAKWLTPNGNWIHEKGIKPDIAVEQPAYFNVAPLSKSSTLMPDQNSEEIKSVQVMLKGLGLDPGRQDGYYSAGTVDAVKSFQTSKGLPVSGKLDKKTAAELEAEIVKEIRKPENDKQLLEAAKYLRELTR